MLAVSGGVDSMVLMHAATQSFARAPELAVVATFDHVTGDHSTVSVAHVAAWAERWGLRLVTGRAPASLRGAPEATLRSARWEFLNRVASEHGATVITAHSRDDHLETIVMRILRGAGARGLSAMRAHSPVRRPLLDFTRAEILEYARAHELEWLEDPSNASRRFLRNRVRLDLLPALLAVDPSMGRALLELADRSASVRSTASAAVRPFIVRSSPGNVVARRVVDATWSPDAVALYWQTVADHAGLALDRRGTLRLARFSVAGRRGTRIPLSGGYEAVHRGAELQLRRVPNVVEGVRALAIGSVTRFGDWAFRPHGHGLTSRQLGAPVETSHPADGSDSWYAPDPRADLSSPVIDHSSNPWVAWLPADTVLQVRPWQAGDRMASADGGQRRVKRFLSDLRVPAADREGWPVVVADGEIVWIPGVRRGSAATGRSGRPRVCFVCQRLCD